MLTCILIHNGTAQDFGILEPSTEILETGFDNRALAMGKTTTITGNSSSTIFSNPALLAPFSKSQVQASGKFLYGIITNEAALEDETYDSYESTYQPFPNRSYVALAVPYRLPHPHLPRPRDWQLVFGIGYQRNEGARGDIQAVLSEESGATSAGQNVSIQGSRRGAMNTITPGVAFNFYEKYFFGLTLNRTIGTIVYTNELNRSDYQVQVDEEREQSATFLRLGALAKVSPELSIGLMYRPEFRWELGGTVTKRYENGELETDRDQSQAALTVPGMFGLGATYKLSPEFSVAVELQSRPFSKLRWTGDINQQQFIDDGFNFAVGAEYLGAGVPLRFGAFSEAIPFVDENDTAPVNLAGLTAGIGSNNDSDFAWNASGVFGTWERVNDVGQKYSENLIRAGISITYHFNTVLGGATTN